MRIATYNVEWFNALFDAQDRLVVDRTWSGRHNVTKQDQIAALGTVFHTIDADAILIVEAPDHSKHRSTVQALENFAGHFELRTRSAVIGFANDTQQEIALLFDPDVVSAEHAPLQSEQAPRFDSETTIDLDQDAHPDPIVFSKPPLELVISPKMGTEFRMIGAHLKSKAPYGARSKDEEIRISIENRRKQLAQAIWVRGRADQILENGDDLIVLGDLNDGPGLDEFENLFGRSSVEVVMGQGHRSLFDPNAVKTVQTPFAERPSTARFFQPKADRYLEALLDYVMISERLLAKSPTWTIWHPFDHPKAWNTPEVQRALLTASDHFPVVLDIDFENHT